MSPDSVTALTGAEDGSACLTNVQTGRLLGTLSGVDSLSHPGLPCCCCLVASLRDSERLTCLDARLHPEMCFSAQGIQTRLRQPAWRICCHSAPQPAWTAGSSSGTLRPCLCAPPAGIPRCVALRAPLCLSSVPLCAPLIAICQQRAWCQACQWGL